MLTEEDNSPAVRRVDAAVGAIPPGGTLIIDKNELSSVIVVLSSSWWRKKKGNMATSRIVSSTSWC